MDICARIDELIEKPLWLIDIFPHTVPPDSGGRYLAVEEHLQRHRKGINRRFANLLLKLYCYYDFVVSHSDGCIENLSPKRLLRCIERCFDGEPRKRDYINIILPRVNAMIILNGDDLYMMLYNPDDELKALVKELAHSEGLFFYEAQRA